MRQAYSFRRSLKWQLWENVAMMAALPVVIIVLGVIGLDLATTILLAAFLVIGAAFIGWGNWWIFRNFAERVVIDDAGIEAKPFYGKPLRMTWDEIAVRQENERRDPFRGVFPQLRLIGSDAHSRIILDGEMERFDELATEVRSRTTNAESGPTRRWWEKVFLPG